MTNTYIITSTLITTVIVCVIIVTSFRFGYKSGLNDGLKKDFREFIKSIKRINTREFISRLPDGSRITIRHEHRAPSGISTFLVKVFDEYERLQYQELTSHEPEDERDQIHNGNYFVVQNGSKKWDLEEWKRNPKIKRFRD